MRQYLTKVLYILRDQKKQLAVMMVVFGFVSVLEAIGIGLIGPFLTVANNPNIVRETPPLASVVDFLGLTSDTQIITVSALVVMGIFVFKSVAYFLCKLNIYRFGYRQKQRLEAKLIYTYLNISYLFHLNSNSSSMISNLVFESMQFTVNSLIPLLEIVANTFVVVLLLGLLAVTDISLLLMALAILLPVFLIFIRVSRRIRGWGETRSDAQAQMIRAINHGLGGLKETRVLGCESYFESDLSHHAKRFGNAAMLADSFQLMPKVAIENVLVIFLILFLLVSQLVMNRSMEEITAVMGVFGAASIRLIPAASQILNSVGRMRAMSYAMTMLHHDLKAIDDYEMSGKMSDVINPDDLLTFAHLSPMAEKHTTPFNHSVALEGITFAYPNSEKPAIENVSLKLKKGESIALVGKSGSGKTTLVDVILGLLHPTSGDITVDSASVFEDLRSWQNLLGYIPQSIFVMDETIAQNVAFGVPASEIDYDRVAQAVKSAQLEEMVNRLPQGLETMVGEHGTRLSGGQRQRIGIARAIYHGREILVLDEATSALDTETEKLVSEAIDSLAGDKTLIIIAHRLSTIENCDRVYRLENGRIQTVGTYQEVAMAASR